MVIDASFSYIILYRVLALQNPFEILNFFIYICNLEPKKITIPSSPRLELRRVLSLIFIISAITVNVVLNRRDRSRFPVTFWKSVIDVFSEFKVNFTTSDAHALSNQIAKYFFLIQLILYL